MVAVYTGIKPQERVIMKSVAQRRNVAACGALLWSACALQTSHAQPPQPEAGNKPPATAQEVNRDIGGPTLITLQHKDALPKAIFEDAAKQGAVELSPYPGLWERERMKAPLTLAIERQPFWLAMRTLTSQTQVYLERYGSRPGLTIIPGSDTKMRGVATMSGPFLIVANYLQHTVNLPDVVALQPVDGQPAISPPIPVVARPATPGAMKSTSKPIAGAAAKAATKPGAKPAPKPGAGPLAPPLPPPPTSEDSIAISAQADFKLAVSAFIDPKVRVIPYLTKFKLDEAVDEKGNSLLLVDAGELAVAAVTPSTLNIAAQLSRPVTMGQRLARLRGSFRFFAVTKRELMEVPNVLTAKDVVKSVAQPAGDKQFTVKSVKKVGEQYEVELSITRQDFIAPESISPLERQMTYYVNADTFRSVRLLDAQGRNLVFYTYRSGSTTTYVVVFNTGAQGAADKPGEPAKLVWEIPVETKEIVVPFEFTHLPLP